MPDLDPLYVAARRVLLDALEALTEQQAAIVVIGAQAVYLRAGEAEIGIAAYTTDGDLALNPDSLAATPLLESAMRGARFEQDLTQPGVWLARQTVDGREILIPVDLMVPAAAAPPGGRRGARLGPHGNRAARQASGLEAALIDHSPLAVESLDPISDKRTFTVEVAGTAALLIAKAHKIHDRLAQGRPDRADDKDAADAYRLMQTSAPEEIATRLAELTQHKLAQDTTTVGIRYLVDLFSRPGSDGTQMAVRALRLAIPVDEVTTLCTNYISRIQRD